jgi:hypothetical protein
VPTGPIKRCGISCPAQDFMCYRDEYSPVGTLCLSLELDPNVPVKCKRCKTRSELCPLKTDNVQKRPPNSQQILEGKGLIKGFDYLKAVRHGQFRA